MLSYKQQARRALQIRIANFKTEEPMDTFIKEAVEELWNIFEDEFMGDINGKKTNRSKSTKNFKGQDNTEKKPLTAKQRRFFGARAKKSK